MIIVGTIGKLFLYYYAQQTYNITSVPRCLRYSHSKLLQNRCGGMHCKYFFSECYKGSNSQEKFEINWGITLPL